MSKYNRSRDATFEEIRDYGAIQKNATQEIRFKLMKVGENYYVDVRIWNIREDDSRMASNKGITIPLRIINDFKEYFDDVFKAVHDEFKALIEKNIEKKVNIKDPGK